MAVDFGNETDIITIAIPGGIESSTIEVVLPDTQPEVITIVSPGMQGPIGPPGDGETASDHGFLSGLLDDDHPQYFNIVRGDARYAPVDHTHEGISPGVIDHGELLGLADDDHTQYHTDARGDARYAPLSHNHTASQISNSTTVGRSVLTAIDAAAARTAIGAGTSSLVIGTTGTTAKAGDYQPTAANISDSTSIGRSVLTAVSSTAARTAIGAGTSDLVIGTTGSTAAAGNDARLSDARTPTDASVTNVKVASGAAISADKLADGTTNVVMTATERTKLGGIATGATANSADATLLARANHTGTQVAATISDLAEAVQDVVGAQMVEGANMDITYDDATGLITFIAPDPGLAEVGYADLPPGSTVTQYKNPVTGWGVRLTSRVDIHVVWKGPDPDPPIVTSGTAGMHDDTNGYGDSRFVTP